MRQSFVDTLFLHWPVPKSELERFVPQPLQVQEHEGTAWVGLVPFDMQGLSMRFVPDVPRISHFPEMNMRLYVEMQGKPGVWFLSLDAGSALVAWAARRALHVPFFRARMSIRKRDGVIHYFSRRKRRKTTSDPAVFRAKYRPVGEVIPHVEKSSLELFLTERYCLYTQAPGSGEILRGELHHQPWPLQRAEVYVDENSVLTSQDVYVNGDSPLVHYAERVDAVMWHAVPTRSRSPVE